MRSDALEAIITMLRQTAEARDGADMTTAEWRAAYDALGQMFPVVPDTCFSEVDAGGVRAEWVVAPTADVGRTVVYLHGGGYCIGSLTSHRAMLSHLSAAAAARVLAVDYRLAPEHPHPAALDDAVTAYRWALTDGGALAARSVLGGDSAGGGLTVATLVALRDAGEPLPAAAVCLSPWTDLTASGTSITTKAAEDPMVRVEDLERWAAAYRGRTPASASSVSPLFADLAGLPPMLLDVGTSEVLLDDARRLAERARAAGIDVTLTVADDMLHVWHFFAGTVPEADEAVARVGEFIAKVAP